MIEVEKKFILSQEDTNRLINEAEFLGEIIFTDIYYDKKDFVLISKDKWLRRREDRFELKLPLNTGADRIADQYEELTSELEIKKALGFEIENNLADALKENGYLPFCVCKTTRKKYKKNHFNIDLNVVEFKEFTYSLGEIEIMVNQKSEIDQAVNEIMLFAQENNLKIGPVRGKVIEYLKRIKPGCYQVLAKVGVIKDFD